MSAPYLEEIEEQLEKGIRTMWEIAENIGIDTDSCALSINNGICKGYWSLVKGEKKFDGTPGKK